MDWKTGVGFPVGANFVPDDVALLCCGFLWTRKSVDNVGLLT
jgi:hypothetical protein